MIMNISMDVLRQALTQNGLLNITVQVYSGGFGLRTVGHRRGHRLHLSSRPAEENKDSPVRAICTPAPPLSSPKLPCLTHPH